jgi:hypothetical protein
MALEKAELTFSNVHIVASNHPIEIPIRNERRMSIHRNRFFKEAMDVNSSQGEMTVLHPLTLIRTRDLRRGLNPLHRDSKVKCGEREVI